MEEIAVGVNNDNRSVTVFETINAIKKAGFKNVFIQWYDKDWDVRQEEQLKYIKKIGLHILFAHLGYQNIDDIWLDNESGKQLVCRYQKNIKDCKENGISMVVMHLVGPNASTYNEIGLKRIKEIVDYAKELDVKVAFENTMEQGYLEYVVDHITNENVGICFDAGHYHVHFKDTFNFEKFKNKIFAVHLHDNDQSGDLHLLPFDGTLNWEETLKHLNACNYNGPITMELWYRNNYFNMSIEDFYKQGYEIGKILRDKIKIIKKEKYNMNKENVLLSNLDKVHTTALGVERIKKNLLLDVEDVVSWCLEKIKNKNSKIIRQGKNWYITIDNFKITVNAYSYTIITAHKIKK